jgi:hypothetical protein
MQGVRLLESGVSLASPRFHCVGATLSEAPVGCWEFAQLEQTAKWQEGSARGYGVHLGRGVKQEQGSGWGLCALLQP